ncbi:MAG: YigZ family protein [Spirochaetales bacterium]|nr:YigZ family protein [Spirochaetia bacterium]MDD7013842.1 YigZ family protein [Spirochaetales bacterium]
MNVLLENASASLVIKNSRFIAEVFPVANQSEAREMLGRQKQRYFDATHVVHAFITGLSGEVNGMSDDGEPSGTAGRPVLDVLKGSGITNILLTVTRYFGGILLGTGGLVHAYSDSAKAVLAACKSEPYVEKSIFSFTCGYELYEGIKRALSKFNLSEVEESFADSVMVKGKIFSAQAEECSALVKNLSKGKVIFSTEKIV